MLCLRSILAILKLCHGPPHTRQLIFWYPLFLLLSFSYLPTHHTELISSVSSSFSISNQLSAFTHVHLSLSSILIYLIFTLYLNLASLSLSVDKPYVHLSSQILIPIILGSHASILCPTKLRNLIVQLLGHSTGDDGIM